MSVSPADISPVTGLKPKTKYFAEVGDKCVNVDGVIAIMQRTDTPQAKAIYRNFRRRLAETRTTSLSPEKQREVALLAAIEDVGVRVSFTAVNAPERADG